MTFDALAMHALRDEVARTIEGGHVDSAQLVDTRRVVLEIYSSGARVWLVYSLSPNDSRIFLSHERVRRTTEITTPFALLLRKYVRGSRIHAVEQPHLERILGLRLLSRPDDGLPHEILFIAEAMGRRSNLVLVDEDGAIMDALLRVPPSVNPARPLLPHLRFSLPSPEQKVDPTDPRLARALASAALEVKGPAVGVMLDQVAGLSPLAASEALFRAGYDRQIAAQQV